MLKRAYSLLEVKDFVETDEFYTISGMATTPTPDRYLDEIDPMGATFAKEIPLLWQHRAAEPIGITELGKPMKKGIPFKARIPNIKEAGRLKDRIDEAVQSIRYRLVAAASIGFRPINDAMEFLSNGGIRYNETEILELSAVTIPANAEATIETIKSIDMQLRLASGLEQKRAVTLTPGVSGSPAAKRGAIKLIPR